MLIVCSAYVNYVMAKVATCYNTKVATSESFVKQKLHKGELYALIRQACAEEFLSIEEIAQAVGKE